MTTILLLIAFLITLGLFLHAAFNALRPSPLRTISSEPTAEDYETYLNAMEAAFKTARVPSFPKTPSKPRQPKQKTPPQASPPKVLEETAANLAPKAKPENKLQVASKEAPHPHTAAMTHFCGQALPSQESPHISKRPINRPLSSESHASATSPPSEIGVHSRPLAAKNPVHNIGENPCSSVVENQPHKRSALLNSCLSKLKQAISWSTSAFKPFLQIPIKIFSFFSRQKPWTPPIVGARVDIAPKNHAM